MNILTSKQQKEYDYLSRYASFYIYYNTLDDKYIYGTTAQISQDVSYMVYKAQAGDSWDSIALQYYNNPTFYWVLCDFNKVQDPYSSIKPNQEIKIPTLTNISYER